MCACSRSVHTSATSATTTCGFSAPPQRWGSRDSWTLGTRGHGPRGALALPRRGAQPETDALAPWVFFIAPQMPFSRHETPAVHRGRRLSDRARAGRGARWGVAGPPTARRAHRGAGRSGQQRAGGAGDRPRDAAEHTAPGTRGMVQADHRDTWSIWMGTPAQVRTWSEADCAERVRTERPLPGGRRLGRSRARASRTWCRLVSRHGGPVITRESTSEEPAG